MIRVIALAILCIFAVWYLSMKIYDTHDGSIYHDGVYTPRDELIRMNED